MVNRSLNQVLMRSINTSIVALLPVASLLFVGTYVFGGLALRDFALALFVGLLTGAYSSIFVATPILAWLKEREPKYRALRERAAADLAKAQAVAPAAPVAPGPAVDVPVDGEDIEPLDDDVDDVEDERRRGRPDHRAGSTRGAGGAGHAVGGTAAGDREHRRGAPPTRVVASSDAASAADPSGAGLGRGTPGPPVELSRR